MYTSLPLNLSHELISFGYKTFLLSLTIMMQSHLEKNRRKHFLENYFQLGINDSQLVDELLFMNLITYITGWCFKLEILCQKVIY